MFELPQLPYPYDALEPFIDVRTMEVHHGKHHQSYVDNLNKVLAEQPDLAKETLEGLLSDLKRIPETIRVGVINHGGGHFNHSFFWRVMGPPSSKTAEGRPSGSLLEEISKVFGDFDKFKTEFSAAAMGRFGSGWAWLVNDGGKLKVESSANQDCPLSEGKKPLLCLDVWEHAYYLKYQNRRKDYVEAWWNVVNWSEVERNFMSV